MLRRHPKVQPDSLPLTQRAKERTCATHKGAHLRHTQKRALTASPSHVHASAISPTVFATAARRTRAAGGGGMSSGGTTTDARHDGVGGQRGECGPTGGGGCAELSRGSSSRCTEIVPSWRGGPVGGRAGE
eukprot:353823-Chlamydomonas_euryale.AAC.1